eukprot:2890092-Alexandrium_andersonii.AAC.1
MRSIHARRLYNLCVCVRTAIALELEPHSEAEAGLPRPQTLDRKQQTPKQIHKCAHIPPSTKSPRRAPDALGGELLEWGSHWGRAGWEHAGTTARNRSEQ